MNSNDIFTILAIILTICGCLLILAVVIVTLLLFMKRRRQNKERDLQWQQVVQGTESSATPVAPIAPVAPVVSSDTDATIIEAPIPPDYTPSSNAIAVLLILQSKDLTKLNRHIEITMPVTKLGRKPPNDIIFARDTLVSRNHAIIEQRQSKLFISEVLSRDDEGHPKRPAFGTFVNGTQIQDPTPLQDGDEIRLDTSVTMRIGSIRPWSMQHDHTVDLVQNNDDKTADDLGTAPG